MSERTHVRCYRSKWRPSDLASVGIQRGEVELPELWPEFLFQRMERGIAGNDGAAKLPFLGMFYQTFFSRIVDDVEADFGESIAFALFFSQDVIVSLMLKLMWKQNWREIFPQKFDSIFLIGVASHSHPNEMNVIWHQAVGRA